jgi:Flp pilus assembly protein TadG
MFRNDHGERGAALVETAIVSIFLLILTFGIIDVGRLFFTTIALNDAVQEGAAYAAFTQEATPASVQDHVRATTSTPDLSSVAVTATCTPVARQKRTAGAVTVSIDAYDVDLLTPFLSAAFGGTITLSHEAQTDRLFPCWSP